MARYNVSKRWDAKPDETEGFRAVRLSLYRIRTANISFLNYLIHASEETSFLLVEKLGKPIGQFQKNVDKD